VRSEMIPAAQTKTRDVPYLDVSATSDEDATTLYLSVVNRHESETIEVPIVIAGGSVEFLRGWEVNGPDVRAENTFEHPNLVRTRPIKADLARGTYAFPAHSHTVLELKLS